MAGEESNGHISHDLPLDGKAKSRSLSIEVDCFPFTEGLRREFERTGIIKWLKNTPQLGSLKVSKHRRLSLYDYVVLQFYLHKLVKCSKKLQGQLAFSYNSKIEPTELGIQRDDESLPGVISVADALQTLSLVYPSGHVRNTFTASKAVVLAAQSDEFRRSVIGASNDQQYQLLAERMLVERDYLHVHILNALLTLEKCDQGMAGVRLASALLRAYATGDFEADSKLAFVFDVYRTVRNLAFTALDLRMTGIPFSVDLLDEKGLVYYLGEALALHNNRSLPTMLLAAVDKLLDDALYNAPSNVLRQQAIANKMRRALVTRPARSYFDELRDPNGVLNRTYPLRCDFEPERILKLTFAVDELATVRVLFERLDRMEHVRVGYYDRHGGGRTIIVAPALGHEGDAALALKLCSVIISALRSIAPKRHDDLRFVLVLKFFMQSLSPDKRVVIKPTIAPAALDGGDETACVFCTKGARAKVREVERLLQLGGGGEDQRHEAEFLLGRLKDDHAGDVCICAPASVQYYEKECNKPYLELDGVILYPNRKKHQLVLLEAKNRRKKPVEAKKCLVVKLKKFGLSDYADEIRIIGHDAVLEVTV